MLGRVNVYCMYWWRMSTALGALGTALLVRSNPTLPADVIMKQPSPYFHDPCAACRHAVHAELGSGERVWRCRHSHPRLWPSWLGRVCQARELSNFYKNNLYNSDVNFSHLNSTYSGLTSSCPEQNRPGVTVNMTLYRMQIFTAFDHAVSIPSHHHMSISSWQLIAKMRSHLLHDGVGWMDFL